MKEVRGSKDKELVLGLCDVNIDQIDINEVIRLGKKTQDGKPRPMKVIMKDPERKVKKLWKLRDATESYRGLSIQNDLTKKKGRRTQIVR